MPGRRLLLTSKDKKVLYHFFSQPKKDNYLELLDSWNSTTRISEDLGDRQDRMLQRLEKLHKFGFLFAFSVMYHNRMDHYWAITRQGIYYILSDLRRDKLAYFLSSNRDKIKEFTDIGKLVLQKDPQVGYLARQIDHMVKNYQFHLLEDFIENWRRTNVSGQYSMLRFFEPNRKKILESIYGKEKIKTFDGFLKKPH